MTDLSFILAGWLGTASVIALYALRLRNRSRRAEATTRRRAS